MRFKISGRGDHDIGVHGEHLDKVEIIGLLQHANVSPSYVRFDPVPGERFDRVLSNPPFHAGVDVLYPLVDEAYAHLRFHGRLYLVLMRYVGVKRHIEKVFGNCRIVAQSEKHTVLMAERMAEDARGRR